jgi:hypothetical protein
MFLYEFEFSVLIVWRRKCMNIVSFQQQETAAVSQHSNMAHRLVLADIQNLRSRDVKRNLFSIVILATKGRRTS